MKLTKLQLKEMIKEELLNERTSYYDQETSQIHSLEDTIDGFLQGKKYKNLLKHDVPEVKKWVKQLIPLLQKSSDLLNKIYEETLGT